MTGKTGRQDHPELSMSCWAQTYLPPMHRDWHEDCDGSAPRAWTRCACPCHQPPATDHDHERTHP